MLTEQKGRCSDVVVLIFGHTLIAGNSSILANHCDVEKKQNQEWRLLRLSAKISALLRLSVCSVTVNKKVNFFCFKGLNIIIIHSKYLPDSDWLKAHV